MSTSMIGAVGGLSAADREKLIPENIRAGVTLFEGTSKEIRGILYALQNKPQYTLTIYYASGCWTPIQESYGLPDYVNRDVTADNYITIKIVKNFLGMAAVFNNVACTIPQYEIRTFEAGESYPFYQYTSQRGGTLAIWKLD